MRKYNKELKNALRSMGYSARITGHTLRVKTRTGLLRLIGILSMLGALALLGLSGYRLFKGETVSMPLVYAAILLLIGGLVLTFLIKGEYFIVNRQIKTIRDVMTKEQKPYRYDFPAQVFIKDIEKRGKYKESRVCFRRGDAHVETFGFKKGKFSPDKIKWMVDSLEVWANHGEKQEMHALPPVKAE